jgi:hypothetical protein
MATPKCQTDLTKESIPPLGASPTLLRPLLPLCCSLSAFAAPPKCQTDFYKRTNFSPCDYPLHNIRYIGKPRGLRRSGGERGG